MKNMPPRKRAGECGHENETEFPALEEGEEHGGDAGDHGRQHQADLLPSGSLNGSDARCHLGHNLVRVIFVEPANFLLHQRLIVKLLQPH